MMFFLFPFVILLLLVAFFSLARGRLPGRRDGEEPAEPEKRGQPQAPPGRWLPLRAPARRADPQARVFRLARKRRGRIMVSDVVIDLGLSVREAEELLGGLVDGLRVRVEARPNGLAVYEFPEILARLGGS